MNVSSPSLSLFGKDEELFVLFFTIWLKWEKQPKPWLETKSIYNNEKGNRACD